MKQLTLMAALVLLVAACNLSSKLKSGNNSNSSSSPSSDKSGKIGDEPVETPNPTAAQTAALANGQEVKWDQQGITWTLPANWKKQDVRTDTLSYGGDGAFLSVNISTMADSFPTEISLQAMHEGAKTEKKNGRYDEVKLLELGGLRGLEFRQSKQERADDIRRLEWQAYRTYAGQTQLVTMILSTSDAAFPKHEDELYAIMYSTKLVH
ncbi:MAG TPA: hypothetical protein VLN44_00480 [Pyrinomonadaceae bacterium]|nr:hypothetical protein [Pyrinomonadaceae bacterium]